MSDAKTEALIKRIASGETTEADAEAVKKLVRVKEAIDAWAVTSDGMGGDLFDEILNAWSDCK